MGQALREGFIVPLPLAEEFFALVLGESLGPANLPRPGGGTAGELVGALADFASELKQGEANLNASQETAMPPDAIQNWRKEQIERTDFAARFLQPPEGTEGATQE